MINLIICSTDCLNIENETHLWLNVTMYDALGMNEVNGRDKFVSDAARFGLRELFLSANTIQQLSASQQLHHNVDMQLMKKHNSNAKR